MRTTNPAKCGGLESTEDIVLTALKKVDGVDVSVHAADLAAHTYNLFSVLRIGQYAMPYPFAYSGTGTVIVADTLYCVPFPVPRTMTFDRIAIRVTTLAADKAVRMGILADNGLVYPGDVVLDAGTVDVSAIGVKAININKQLTKGLYWRCFVSNGAPFIARDHMHFRPLGLADTMIQDQDTWEGAFAYGVLTDDPAGLAMQARSGYPWGIHLRLKSLD